MKLTGSAPSAVFATVRDGLRLEDCQFYHTMEIPNVGLVLGFGGGNWDLRGVVEELLGGVDFLGKRVLEIGPASGFLTFEMERRGAQVVCAEIPNDHVYDIVPYPEITQKWQDAVNRAWVPMTNSWWFARERFGSAAKMMYSGAYDLTRQDIGRFDLTFVSNMLLHNRDPLRILQNCASITDGTIMVVDIVDQKLEGLAEPLLRFVPDPRPNPDNENWNQWWRLSSRFVADAISVLGFRNSSAVTRFSPLWNGIPVESFRVVADR